MGSSTSIVVTLIIYKILLIVFGVIAQRKTQSKEDYFLGGRGLGPVVAAISASASSSSAWTLLGVSGAAYAWGLPALWIFPACIGGFALNWYVLAPALHRESHQNGALTPTELLSSGAGRYSGALTKLASAIILLSLCTYVATQFEGAGKAFHTVFGLSVERSILLGSAIVVFYTLLGGFWAVSLTDTLQGMMMALTSIILPVTALIAVGGPGPLFAGLGEIEGALHWTKGQGAAGLGFIFGLLGIGLGYPGQPHVVNRFMALESDPKALKIARRLAMTWALVVYVGMLTLGWCGRVLYPNVADKEAIFMVATKGLFHPTIAGIMLAAVLSAIMSTADSQLLVAASTLTHDLGLGGKDQRSMIKRSRWVVFGLSVVAVIAALYSPKEIFSKVLFAWSAMGAAFGPLLLVLVTKGPVPGPYRLAAMASGFVLSVGAYMAGDFKLFERIVPFVVAGAIAYWGANVHKSKT